jgi:FkbM family methyltransferase
MQGACVAFEPSPLALPELYSRCAHRKNWTLVTTALGSAAAIATLHARESSGQSSLLAEWEGKVVAAYHVPVVTLDAAISPFGLPAYCKIDVEGWELEVLYGLSRPIPLVSFELHLTEGEIAKSRACLERLAQFGPSHANITRAEAASLSPPSVDSDRGMIQWFPCDLVRTLPAFPAVTSSSAPMIGEPFHYRGRRDLLDGYLRAAPC